jgi:predicted RNA-binding Zn-ribbon protein involved in translation (DUF1610 family)
MEDLTTAGLHSIRCPFCEVYELERSGYDSVRCTSCGGSLDAELPDGMFHCPACGAEILSFWAFAVRRTAVEAPAPPPAAA